MKLLLVFAIGCIALTTATTLTCYECTSFPSAENKECKNAADKYAKKCPLEGSCVKSVSDDGKTLVRSCWITKEKDRCEKVEQSGNKFTSCYCNKDKCNSSNIMSSSVAALSAIFAVIIFNCY